jgi:ATP-dependent Clp protease protease subunit
VIDASSPGGIRPHPVLNTWSGSRPWAALAGQTPSAAPGILPTVVEQSGRGDRAFDIYSRLLRERIIFLGSGIDDQVADALVAQLLFLEADLHQLPGGIGHRRPGDLRHDAAGEP